MAQITIRLDDQLARDVTNHAKARGRSLNSWVVAVLRAAVDPDLAESESERTRARLARAGLLYVPARRPPGPRLDEYEVAEARRAAGTGTPLSTIVSEQRD